MKKPTTSFERARRMDGKTIGEMCEALNITRPTWDKFATEPESQPADRIKAFYNTLSPEARELVGKDIDRLVGRA